MEHGYFHPELGYWQTLTRPSDETLQSYPAGTVEVPLRPTPDHRWNGSAWVLEVPQ